MNYIDLHVHSNASDGTLSPSDVVRRVVKNNIVAFALTDHDTIDGIDEAITTAKQLSSEFNEIRVIPGTELSVAYKGNDIHLLGLLIDHKNDTLVHALSDAKKERDIRNLKMIANLNSAGIDISMEKLRSADSNAVLTRAHFAKYMLNHNYVQTIKEAFVKYLDDHGPYYVPRNYIKPKEAINLIKLAQGVPVLAHPLLYKYSMSELDTLVSYLKDCGLVGIETIYHANTGFDESNVRKLANKYDLLMTGGSDFHGEIKPDLDIGVGRGNLKIPYTFLEKLDEYKRIQKTAKPPM